MKTEIEIRNDWRRVRVWTHYSKPAAQTDQFFNGYTEQWKIPLVSSLACECDSIEAFRMHTNADSIALQAAELLSTIPADARLVEVEQALKRVVENAGGKVVVV